MLKKEDSMIKPGSLLDMVVRVRTYRALDKAVEKDKSYQNISKKQDKVYAELDKAGLNKEQRILVDRAITVTNESGTAYGVAAYRLGLQDGARLVSELRKI